MVNAVHATQILDNSVYLYQKTKHDFLSQLSGTFWSYRTDRIKNYVFQIIQKW